ncbi:MAG: hypothetical protein MUE95_12640 [Cyclobacteriaceae bacterium]|jgi:hypothetical protein|nr:hypothetical protein [Cyclobacteriaceae bacterium]
MGKTVLKRNNPYAPLIPMLMVTMISFFGLINSIGREPWRVTMAGIGFTGLLLLSVICWRLLKKRIQANANRPVNH